MIRASRRSRARRLRVGQLRRHDLERHVATELAVARGVDDAHAAAGHLVPKLVPRPESPAIARRRAGGRGRGRSSVLTAHRPRGGARLRAELLLGRGDLAQLLEHRRAQLAPGPVQVVRHLRDRQAELRGERGVARPLVGVGALEVVPLEEGERHLLARARRSAPRSASTARANRLRAHSRWNSASRSLRPRGAARASRRRVPSTRAGRTRRRRRA